MQETSPIPTPVASVGTGDGAAQWLRPGRLVAPILGLWLILRIVTSLWVAYLSALRPLTIHEQQFQLWPPLSPFTRWLERVLLDPWLRWDVNYYVRIIEQGYRVDDGTAQFHPLLPWLATPVAQATGQPILGLLLVTSIAGVLLLLCYERLARLDLDPEQARTSTLLFLFFPSAIVLFAPYTEALFLLWAVLCFWFARKQAWWLAGLAGALATLTRQQGIFLVIPLAWELWEAAGRRPRRALAAWHTWLSLGIIPAALLAWMLYRAVALGDLHPSLSDPRMLIYGLLVSPSANKVVPIQAFVWPWQALWWALDIFIQKPTIDLAVDLLLGGIFLGLLALAWRAMRPSYRLYALAITLVSFGYYTGPKYPYMGLPRHLLLAFPVFIGLGSLIRQSRVRQAYIVGGATLMIGLLFLFALEAWVP